MTATAYTPAPRPFTIQTRQRLPEAANYGVWVDVPGPFNSYDHAIGYAAEMCGRSHDLDIRVVRANDTHTIIRDDGPLA